MRPASTADRPASSRHRRRRIRLRLRRADRRGLHAARTTSTVAEHERGGRATTAQDAVRGLAVSADGTTLRSTTTSCRAGARAAALPHPGRRRAGGPRLRGGARPSACTSSSRGATWPASAPAPAHGARRDVEHAGHAAARPATTASSPTSSATGQDDARRRLAVDGAVDWRHCLPRPAGDDAGGYEVDLDAGLPRRPESELRFTVSRAGGRCRSSPTSAPAATWSRCATATWLPAHPPGRARRRRAARPTPRESPSRPSSPTAGRYRLFLQFKHHGRVRTAAFTARCTLEGPPERAFSVACFGAQAAMCEAKPCRHHSQPPSARSASRALSQPSPWRSRWRCSSSTRVRPAASEGRDLDLARLLGVGLELPARRDVPADDDAVRWIIGEDPPPAAPGAVVAAVVDLAADPALEHPSPRCSTARRLYSGGN